MWRGDEDNLSGTIEEVGDLRVASLLFGATQHLLDKQSPKAVANEGNVPLAQFWFIDQEPENIGGFVNERHGRSEPIAWRRYVSKGIDSKTADILRKPKRPKRPTIPVPTPRVVGMPTKSMNENDSAALLSFPIRNFYKPRHRSARQLLNCTRPLELGPHLPCMPTILDGYFSDAATGLRHIRASAISS